MQKFDCIIKMRFRYKIFSFFLLLLLSFFFQSCSSEKDIAASADDFNQIHKGPSYPVPSYDDGAYFYNMFMEFIMDFDPFKWMDVAEQTDHSSNTKLMVKLQFIQKGSQSKYTNGKTVIKLSYIEVPL